MRRVVSATHLFLQEALSSFYDTKSKDFCIVKQIDDSLPSIIEILSLEADIVILDLSKKCADDLTQLKDIISLNSFFIVFLEEGSSLVKPLVDMGIRSIVNNRCDRYEFQQGLLAAEKNSRFYSSVFLDKIMTNTQKDTDIAENLSSRELEVLRLIVFGNTTRKIAEKLYISVHTVNSHRKNLLKKLNIKSPIHLVSYAIENQLVDLQKKD